MSESTYAGKLGALARFVGALAANASELPHLEGPRGRIEAVFNEAQGVARDQAALTASKQEASRRLKALLTEGERLADGLRKFLREHYGLRSEKLAEFGLQPFRGRARARKPEDPEPKEPPQLPASPAVPAIDPQ